MQTIRLWFSKDGRAKYISHLDLNRCMSRMVHLAKIPLWYTEGFNPHPFFVFALALPLGVAGERETMDIRLLENMEKEEILSRLNRVFSGCGVQFFDVTQPQKKPGEIAYAKYRFVLETACAKETAQKIAKVLETSPLLVEKRSKSQSKMINLKECLYDLFVQEKDGSVEIKVTLPAGSVQNINPWLLSNALQTQLKEELFFSITRLCLLDENFAPFC